MSKNMTLTYGEQKLAACQLEIDQYVAYVGGDRIVVKRDWANRRRFLLFNETAQRTIAVKSNKKDAVEAFFAMCDEDEAVRDE